MKKVLAVALVALVICILMPAAIGCAPKEFQVSGTMIATASTVDANPKLENDKWMFPNNSYSGEIHGTIEGTWESEYKMAIDMGTGYVTIMGQATFTGTVNGKSGSYVGYFLSTCQDLPLTSGTYTTDFTIISSSGDLADLTGSLHFENIMSEDGNTATYSGMYFE